METQKIISSEEAKELTMKILKSEKFLSVATIKPDGWPNIRILAISESENLDTLWFCTSLVSEKIAELNADSHMTLYGYQAKTMSEFRLFGKAEIFTDLQTKHHLWKEEYKIFWPQGPESPDMAVIKFTTDHGTYSSMESHGVF
ncbi:MAG: pyridoxamine 5'-phosphate oxidase family protein [Planctomycetia bacterium]|nr:pyridoxamine 5'-phosphate oxidase family protein [Planctomycetia bacterium]